MNSATAGAPENRPSESDRARISAIWSGWTVLAASLSLFLLLLTIHGPALRGWWLNDDPQIVLQALRDTPAETLFDAASWQRFSTSNFTPEVILSFDLDLTLAGFSARPFYLHQLLAIYAAAFALMFLGSADLGRRRGWLLAALFLAAPPTALAARNLLVRHYIEGLLFALVAILIWRAGGVGSSRRRVISSISSALLYLLAMLAKEVFVPLPLILMADARRRGERWPVIVRGLIPHAIAAGIYLLWRRAMLGSLGGYGGLPAVSAIATLPRSLFQSAFSGASSYLSLAVLVVLVGTILYAIVRGNRSLLLISMVLAVVVFLPLIAVANDVQWRYAFVPAVALLFLFLYALPRGGLSEAVAVVLALLLLAATFSQRRAIAASEQRMISEGRYVWIAPPEARPLLADSPGWYLTGLQELRRNLRQEAAPRFVLSAYPLIAGELAPGSVVTADAGGVLRPLPRKEGDALASRKGRRSASDPFTIEFQRRRHDLFWTATSTGGGKFLFLSYPYYDDFELPQSGWRRIPEAGEQQFFRIWHEGNDGWSVTPVLRLPRPGETVRWTSEQTSGVPLLR